MTGPPPPYRCYLFLLLLFCGFVHAAEQKVTYSIVPGDKIVSFNTLNGADDDYVMKFTVSGRWAEIYISSSLGWSGESGQSPRRISDCSEDSDPSSEQYTFTQGDLGSWNMWGDGWNGPTAECGGDGGEGGTTPTFYVRIEDDRKFDVRAVGATSALVGDRLQLRGVVYYPDDTQTFVAVESDWTNPPSNASLYDAASMGNHLTGEGLKNHKNVYAEASEAGPYTFGALPHGETDSEQSKSETLKFHSVYLGIEGVGDEYKEDPGGYLGMGVLQKINVALNPERMEATSLTLTVQEGSGVVKIWENENRTNEFIDGTESQKTWTSEETVPDHMYVELLSTTTETEVNLELAYDGSGDNENGVDRIKFDLVVVEIVEDSTTKYNFSPSLSETSKIRVNIHPPPPEGGMDGFHFKLEIVRETKSGDDQPIEWINVSDIPNAPGAVRDVNFDSELFTWNGKPGEIFGTSAAAAEGPAEFMGVSAGFHRYLPPVTLNQCVPPPLYTVVARILKNSDDTVIAEDRRNIFVPQVVKMVYDADAVAELRKEMPNPDGMPNVIEQMTDAEWNNLRQQISSEINAYYGNSVNIRVVDSSINPKHPYSTLQLKYVLGANAYGWVEETDFPNMKPNDAGILSILTFRGVITDYFVDNPTTMELPVSPTEHGFALSKVGAHELGHLLGLVAEGTILDGTSKSHNKPPYSPRVMMNPGQVGSTFKAVFGREGGWTWRVFNKSYLKFVLPVE